jgi:hypothetical protein
MPRRGKPDRLRGRLGGELGLVCRQRRRGAAAGLRRAQGLHPHPRRRRPMALQPRPRRGLRRRRLRRSRGRHRRATHRGRPRRERPRRRRPLAARRDALPLKDRPRPASTPNSTSPSPNSPPSSTASTPSTQPNAPTGDAHDAMAGLENKAPAPRPRSAAAPPTAPKGRTPRSSAAPDSSSPRSTPDRLNRGHPAWRLDRTTAEAPVCRPQVRLPRETRAPCSQRLRPCRKRSASNTRCDRASTPIATPPRGLAPKLANDHGEPLS